MIPIEEKVEARMKELYNIAKNNKESVKPKRSMFGGAKCPKCNEKLQKESIKEMVHAGPEASEFVNKIINDAELPPGFYNVKLESFTCQCGYQFVQLDLDTVGSGG